MELGNLLERIQKRVGSVYEISIDEHTENICGQKLLDANIKNHSSNPIKRKRQTSEKNEKLESIVKQLSINILTNQELFSQCLLKIVKFDTEKNSNLLEKRTELLHKHSHDMLNTIAIIVKIGLTSTEKSAFLLDHMLEINSILTAKKIAYHHRYELLNSINKDNFNNFIDYAKSSNTDKSFSAKFVYNTKPHRIELSNTMVEVNSSEIISLLSGVNSISFNKTGLKDEYHKEIQKLIKTNDKVSEIQYARIVEAILLQAPKLAHIAKAYQELDSKCRTWLDDYEDVIKKQEQFFDYLEKKEILTRKIQLKAIIPDINALRNPIDTLELFLART